MTEEKIGVQNDAEIETIEIATTDVDVCRCNFNRFDFRVVLHADFFFRHTISPLSMQR